MRALTSGIGATSTRSSAPILPTVVPMARASCAPAAVPVTTKASRLIAARVITNLIPPVPMSTVVCAGRKPIIWARSVTVPVAGSPEIRKAPDWSVNTPTLVPVRTTWAFTTGMPSSSTTIPETEPACWAAAGSANNSSKRARAPVRPGRRPRLRRTYIQLRDMTGLPGEVRKEGSSGQPRPSVRAPALAHPERGSHAHTSYAFMYT